MQPTPQLALGVSIGLSLGLSAGLLARRRPSLFPALAAAASPVSSQWGWFTQQHPDQRPPESLLLVVDSKVPMREGAIIYVPKACLESADGLSGVVKMGETAGAVDATDDQTWAAEQLGLTSRDEVKWVDPRGLLRMAGSARPIKRPEAEAVIRAVSLLKWHRSAAFHGADGKPTSWAAEGHRRKSASGRTLYPRVNPVAIVIVESADGERCLLGRQKAYPPGMYTCVSGFVEHGESAENAAAREVLEETAVVVEFARLVGSQPWPCGRGAECELMLGCVARACVGQEDVDVSVDGGGGGELEEARWFTREEVRVMLDRANRPPAAPTPTSETTPKSPAVVPPSYAIAHHLIARWHDRSLV